MKFDIWRVVSKLTFFLLGMAVMCTAVVAQTKAGSTSSARPKTATATSKRGTARKIPSKKAVPRSRAQTAPTPDRIVEIQQALGKQGFYAGAPTGKWDAETSVAMSKFQTANGLTPTGKLGALSLQKLGLGSEIAGKGAPNPQADPRPSVLTGSELSAPETKEQ